MVGIVGYGTHIPGYRIKVEEIAEVWGADAPAYKKGLNLNEKSAPVPDEDRATLSVSAARSAVRPAEVNPEEIGVVFVGSESYPFAAKPTGILVHEALGACPYFHTADIELTCKAGTKGMLIAFTLIKIDVMLYVLWIGTNTSHGIKITHAAMEGLANIECRA